VKHGRGFLIALQSVGAILLTAGLGAAQQPATEITPSVTSNSVPPVTASDVGAFFGGAAVALAAHETGHLIFDAIFDSHPTLKGVSFHGVPFFAITHESGLPDRREFVIDSAGFWVQEGTNEWILHRHPDLRHEHAPFTKGAFAFNVLASVAYAGAAFARTGPGERDTRGMADALHWKEPLVGLMILAPAVLDAVRFYHPGARWATWGSRGAKAFSVVLVIR
jgi:hypothetical protein